MTIYTSKLPNSNGIIDWTDAENETWNKLITRQMEMTKIHASEKFLEGLERIRFSQDKIPQHLDINKSLKKFTGWEVEVVPALIPAKEFFTLLANKKFPAASFIRIPEELDYIQEPDIFHEFFGHVPLLTFPEYADFMENFGKLALSIDPKDRRRLFRLFWFTIEFGLIQNKKEGLKAYGGGMLSSIHETKYSVTSTDPVRNKFDILDVLRTPYRIDIPQPLYYVIEDMGEIYQMLNRPIKDLLIQSKELGDFQPLFEMETKEL